MATKPKTQAQLDRATDLRLIKEYGKGLAWYNEQFELQGGGCAVCGDPPGTRRLHVDHDHRWTKVKIRPKNYPDCWQAEADYCGQQFYSTARTKSEALTEVKEKLKAASVRALLCHRCNRSLILLRDSPELLRKAADYLENFQKGRPFSGRSKT